VLDKKSGNLLSFHFNLGFLANKFPSTPKTNRGCTLPLCYIICLRWLKNLVRFPTLKQKHRLPSHHLRKAQRCTSIVARLLCTFC